MVEEEAPRSHEGSHRDIERTTGTPTPVEGSAEKGEGFRIGGDGMKAGFTADAGEFTTGAVVAEKRFDPINLIEGDLHPLLGRLRIGGVEVDGELGAHGRMDAMEEQKGFRLCEPRTCLQEGPGYQECYGFQCLNQRIPRHRFALTA